MSPTVAVVGASLAGLSAARALRDQSYDGHIVVIGDEVHAPYDRPPLSKDFLAGTASLDDIALGAPDDEDLGLEWRLRTTAVGLDHVSRSVLLDDGSEIRADGVVLATGARARRLRGSEGLDGVHVLRSLDDDPVRADRCLGRRAGDLPGPQVEARGVQGALHRAAVEPAVGQ